MMECGYWQISTTDADIEAGYQKVDIKFQGYINELPKFVRDNGIDVPFHRLSLTKVQTVPLSEEIISSKDLGTIDEHFLSHGWEIKID